MKTIATPNFSSQPTVQLLPQLHVEIRFARPIEPRQAIFALRQGEVNLVYDDKYCSFRLVSFSHADTCEITSLEAFIDLEGACFHQGQFFEGQTCTLVMEEGTVLATATIVEVKCPALSYWDWKHTPEFLGESEVRFDAEQTDCFLMNLEFEMLDLSFTQDYNILKPKSGDYDVEIRLFSSEEALSEIQARQLLDALYNLSYEYYQLKPSFYQLGMGEQLENFECSFIIGDGSQFITGHFIVI